MAERSHGKKAWSEEARKQAGFGAITDFFKKPPTAGRPSGSKVCKRGAVVALSYEIRAEHVKVSWSAEPSVRWEYGCICL